MGHSILPLLSPTPQHDHTYTRHQLISMSKVLDTCIAYKTLPFGAINAIREFKINRKLILDKRSTRTIIKQTGINKGNLVKVQTNFDQLSKFTRIGTLNARSVKNKSDLILETCLLHNLDMAVITETWLKDTDEDQAWLQSSEMTQKEYRLDTINRNKRKGGGIALLYRKDLHPTRLQTSKYDTLEAGRWKVSIKNKQIVILGIYHPPLGSSPSNTSAKFLEETTDLIQNTMSKYKNLVILGDFNIHIRDLEDQDAVTYSDTMEAMGLQQHILQPTHRLGHTLDLIYTESTDNIKVIESFIGEYTSDHRLVGIELEIRKHRDKVLPTKRRDYKEFSIDSFSKHFDQNSILERSDLETAMDQMEHEMERVLDITAPHVVQKISTKEVRPWYNASLLEQRKIVRNREKIYNAYRQDHQWQAYKRERNRYIRMLDFNKRNFILGRIVKATNNSKQLFSIVEGLLGNTKENPLPPGRTSSQLAEEFADFFLNKIQRIREKLKDTPAYQPTQLDIPQLRKFTPVTKKQLWKIISNMPSKTCRLDIIPTDKLKEILDSILPSLCHIVNLSLNTSQFCNRWKEAIVKPLIKKKGVSLEKSNYRPVSNLSFMSKIVEKVTLEQFTGHCDKNRLIPDYQSAYRKNHSCETSLVKLVNDILWSMEARKVTAVVILDLSAAFDTVDHDLLLDVLENRFGIKDRAREWYFNYLKSRMFKVSIEGTTSKPRQLEFSVPQGSIQGAFLFISYASTLDEIVKDLTLNGFADDHSVRKDFTPCQPDQSTSPEEEETIAAIENSMQDIKSWMDSVRLKMNDSKTEFIYFGGNRQLRKCRSDSINVNGENIERTNITRYLGAHLDSTLSMKQHVKAKCKAAMYNLFKIRAARKYLTREAATKLTIALVISHLDYANAILLGLPDTTINHMQRVQNLAAKVVLGRSKYDSTTKALEQLHWIPIKSRIEIKTITLVHRCLHGKAPPYLQQLLLEQKPKRQGLRSEGQHRLLVIPRTTRTTFASRAFSVKGPQLWNALPNHIRKIEDYEIFKRHLKTYYFRLSFF